MRLPVVLAGLALVLSSVTVEAQRVVGYYGKVTQSHHPYSSFAFLCITFFSVII